MKRVALISEGDRGKDPGGGAKGVRGVTLRNTKKPSTYWETQLNIFFFSPSKPPQNANKPTNRRMDEQQDGRTKYSQLGRCYGVVLVARERNDFLMAKNYFDNGYGFYGSEIGSKGEKINSQLYFCRLPAPHRMFLFLKYAKMIKIDSKLTI